MQISNIEKVVSYYSSICEALPIGGHGIKVLHDALLEIAVLKAGGVSALQTTNTQSTQCSTCDRKSRGCDCKITCSAFIPIGD